MGAAAAHTLAVVAPVVARVVTAHCRRCAAMPHPAVAATTLTRVATTTAHLLLLTYLLTAGSSLITLITYLVTSCTYF